MGRRPRYPSGAKAGVRITSVKWDADRLKITCALGVGSPIAGAAIIAFLKFLFWMFLALGLSYFVDRIISYLTGDYGLMGLISLILIMYLVISLIKSIKG
jgi:hypothetical protein